MGKILLIVVCALIVIGASRGGQIATVASSTPIEGGPLLLVLVGLLIYAAVAGSKG